MRDDQAASEELTPTEREIRHLRSEVEMLTRAGVIEVAVRNPNVSSYMQEWESRAEKAEAQVLSLLDERDRLREALKPFADRCAEAVRPDDSDNDGLTVRTRYLRRARSALGDA